MLFIGICGASGSGKSTLAEQLQLKIRQRVILLAQDAYYRDHSQLPFHERERINYDEPQAFDHDQLYADILALREGRPITRKQYDYTQHCRADRDEWIEPADVVLLEGIHAFFDPRLRALMDMRIFIRVDADVSATSSSAAAPSTALPGSTRRPSSRCTSSTSRITSSMPT